MVELEVALGARDAELTKLEARLELARDAGVVSARAGAEAGWYYTQEPQYHGFTDAGDDVSPQLQPRRGSLVVMVGAPPSVFPAWLRVEHGGRGQMVPTTTWAAGQYSSWSWL